jgi:RNA ligase (TIGR02306 family)
MRKLATVRKIDEIRPIEGADAIELAIIGGWQTVIKKNEYRVGDLAVYCEIDSWIPTILAPFLSKGKEPRVFNGIKGERLRTVKLRGALSQGLLLPMFVLAGEDSMDVSAYAPGDDCTEYLRIQKWEMPIPAQLAGEVKGNFPTGIPKTDQERCQNLVKEITAAMEAELQFEVTEKLEGSSMTCYLIDGVFGVCSRNLDLKETDANAFWQVARKEKIEEKMRAAYTGSDFALQGELIGPGIQGNIYKLSEPEFRIFDIYNVSGGFYAIPSERKSLVEEMGLKHVPILASAAELVDTLGITDIPQLLSFAEGKSVMGMIGCEREGIVFKQVNGGMSFKAISNRYLAAEK